MLDDHQHQHQHHRHHQELHLVCNEEIESSSSSTSSPDDHRKCPVVQNPGGNFFSSKSPDPQEEASVLRNLARKEAQLLPDSSYSTRLKSHQLVSEARSNAVHWMIKVRNVYGFAASTVALSVSYLDRYLSRELEHRDWKTWMIELVSVACLSVAAKMEEHHVPLLQDLQIEGLEHLFESVTIQRMEVTVMRLLDWRMSPVTPLSFAVGFVQTLELQQSIKTLLWNRINELVLGSLTEPSFLEFSPSILGTSATLCALDEVVPLQAEVLKRVLLKSLPLEEARVDDCYSKLEEFVVDPVHPIHSSSQVLECFPKGSSEEESEPLSKLNRKRGRIENDREEEAHHAGKKMKKFNDQ